MYSRFSIAQNDSIPFVCAMPFMNSLAACLTALCSKSTTPKYAFASSVNTVDPVSTLSAMNPCNVGLSVSDTGFATTFLLSLLCAYHGNLANRPAPCIQLLRRMLVSLLAADIGLVHFHYALHSVQQAIPKVVVFCKNL